MGRVKKIILTIVILALGLLTACGNAAPEPEKTPTPVEQSSSEIPENSILYFGNDEGSAKLVQCFEEGNTPEEATILYDQMGSNPEITITDLDKVQDLYLLLAKVTVVDETDMTVTDNYHYVQFKLPDGEYVYYSFEGSDIWCYGKQNCTIENSGKLFRFMKELTDEYWDKNS